MCFNSKMKIVSVGACVFSLDLKFYSRKWCNLLVFLFFLVFFFLWAPEEEENMIHLGIFFSKAVFSFNFPVF